MTETDIWSEIREAKALVRVQTDFPFRFLSLAEFVAHRVGCSGGVARGAIWSMVASGELGRNDEGHLIITAQEKESLPLVVQEILNG